MRRLIITICCIFLSMFAWAGIHTYANQSVLSEGNIVKVSVSETGIHCIPYDTLKVWGLRPADVRVLGYGGGILSENFTLARWDDVPSVAFHMEKGADGVFNSGDYILFYAQGATRWDLVNSRWCHTQNPYSNYGYYFISDSAGEQRLIENQTAVDNTQAIVDVDWYTYYAVHEQDLVNLLDVNAGVNGGGREFYGELLNANQPKRTINFSTTNVRTDLPSCCLVDLAATSSTSSTIEVRMNESTKMGMTAAISVSDNYTRAEPATIKLESKATTTGEQQVEIEFRNTSAGALAYLNYVEVNIPCELKMRGKEMAISNTSKMMQAPYIRFTMSNATAQTEIWRVTDGVNIERMAVERNGNKLIWIGDNANAEKYIALTPTATGWLKPKKVGRIKNQNLHALQDIDYVIICPEEFKEPATRLAKKHEEIDNLTWAIVSDEEVYNEFSSGTPDASAYRWLMKMLYDRKQSDRAMSVLLLGYGSYDNRKILSRSGNGKLLTYQAYNSLKETHAYATDDYFGFMQDNAGITISGDFKDMYATMDIGVGRLPAKTLEEANNMVDKLCRYMDDPDQSKWKSQLLFVADDGDHGLHVQGADTAAEKLRTKNKDFIVNKIYLDAYTQETNAGGESYPLAKNQFDNLLNNGVLMFNYSGHGGYNNITNELFMKTGDIQRMHNQNQAFWMMATCSFSHCDGGVVSAGEEAVLNPNGGAIGVLAACRTVYATQNEILNLHFCDTILGHKNAWNYHMTLGEATRIAKNRTGRDMNKMPYILLGDPALRLLYPTDYQIKTTTQIDSIHALSIQTIQGYIQTEDNDTADWFNGIMDITILDKIQKITTRDNDEPNSSRKVKIDYWDYPNTLFAGQTDVINGNFEFTFMVPKDIRYNYGNGRIVYYARDTINREEAVGHFENFMIGGSSTVTSQDTLGPELKIYLNHPAFTSGDATYEFPYFYAEMYDEHGINTVGSGIGHDLMLVIDQDPQQTYVLNQYFTANNNSYKEGVVRYKMLEQTEGSHSLSFRAWDLYNNSSTATLDYQVIKGKAPIIYSIATYPNPVSKTEALYIDVAFDQPNELVEMQFNLYNLSGQLVYSHIEGNASNIVLDMNQINAESGIYIYQINIKTATSEYVSRTGKIIIK